LTLRDKQTAGARLALILLAALAAVLGLVLPALSASAVTLSAAETRVGASDLAGGVAVGVHECITAGQRPVRGPSQLQVAAGSCVAAEAAPRMGGSTIGGVDHATSNMIKYSNKHPEAGMYDVIGHGSPNDIAGRSAAEVADRVRAASGGQDIRLLSCQTGCPTGTFAQDLANALGARVKAPTTDIGASSRGNTLTIFDGGEWRWFSPQG
jgi:hypothetical protein